MLRYYDKSILEWTVVWDEYNVSNPGPINRADSSMWIDKNNNVWIYGGKTKDGTYLCDFWMYNVVEGNWTDHTPMNSSVRFGQVGVESNITYPGCRRGMAVWYTADDHSLWMVFGLDYNYLTVLSFVPPAVWKYSIASGMWMWFSGPGTPKTNNTNAVAGEFSFDNTPSSRWAPYSAIDTDNNVWYVLNQISITLLTFKPKCFLIRIYGGEQSKNFMNDLWVFNRTLGWKKLGGVNSYLDTVPANTYGNSSKFSADAWPPRAEYNSMTYIPGGFLALSFGFADYATNGAQAKDEDWYYDVYTNQWVNTYKGPGVNPQPVTDVLYVPDNSTRPGSVYYSRTISQGILWAVGDKSRSIFVKEFDKGSICDTEPCSPDATCSGFSCTCNGGYEGHGHGDNGCTLIPIAPVTPPVTPAAPVAKTSSGSDLVIFASVIISGLLIAF